MMKGSAGCVGAVANSSGESASRTGCRCDSLKISCRMKEYQLSWTSSIPYCPNHRRISHRRSDAFVCVFISPRRRRRRTNSIIVKWHVRVLSTRSHSPKEVALPSNNWSYLIMINCMSWVACEVEFGEDTRFCATGVALGVYCAQQESTDVCIIRSVDLVASSTVCAGEIWIDQMQSNKENIILRILPIN